MKKQNKIIRECDDCGLVGDQEKYFLFLSGSEYSCYKCGSRNTGIVKTVKKKKKREKPVYKDIEFASYEEIEFYQWCEEAKQAALIFNFVYQPPSYTLSTKQTYTMPVQLKTKVRYDEKTLLKPHVYTADFMIYIEPGDDLDFLPMYTLFGNSGEILIDVKGNASSFDDGRTFSINQKWLYEKHGIYVNKVIPEDFFKKTWIPDRARYTFKTRKLRKKFVDYPSIGDYLNGA